jgi:hypothetical protein
MKNTLAFLNRSLLSRSLLATLGALGLSACSTPPTALDQRFGLSVKEAQTRQTLNQPPCHNTPAHRCMPHGHHGQAQPPDSDGVTAKAAIELYQKTFETPPPAAPVFNIGIGSSSTR